MQSCCCAGDILMDEATQRHRAAEGGPCIWAVCTAQDTCVRPVGSRLGMSVIRSKLEHCPAWRLSRLRPFHMNAQQDACIQEV